MPPRPRFDRRAPVRELPNINDRISYPQLRVVDADGEQLGVIDREKALEVARERELDLVLVSEKADPPVCRIFRGREIQHTALAEVLLRRMAKDLEEPAEVQQPPKREGRNMIMFLTPRKAPLLKKDKEDGAGNNAVRTIPSPARRIITQD